MYKATRKDQIQSRKPVEKKKKHSSHFQKYHHKKDQKLRGVHPFPVFDYGHSLVQKTLDFVRKVYRVVPPDRKKKTSLALVPLPRTDGDGFIPFVKEMWKKGTQIPVIRLYYSGEQVVSTGGSDILHVSDVEAQEFTGMAELCQVFDEYRPLAGEFRFTPAVTVSLRNDTGIDFHAVATGLIDFVNGNPSSSWQDALAHDTSKTFHTCHSEKWTYEFDFAPDQNWTSSATLTTPFGYLKLYSDTTLGCTSSQTYGFITGWIDFQFRLA